MAGIRIDRATVRRATSGDRERLVAALQHIPPSATGIPAKAILVIGRLAVRTPLPREGSPERFATTLRDTVRARLAGASRGPHRSVDGDYLFDDDAALEAAIVVDWLDCPPKTARAWWTAITGPALPPERWRRMVLHDMPALPRIVAQLLTSGHATRWLARFEESELRAATDRLLLQAGAATLTATAVVPTERPAQIGRHLSGATSVATTAPILEIVPEIRDFASPAARSFVAVALTLVRRPSLVATRRFAEALFTLRENVPVGRSQMRRPDRATAAAALASAPLPQKARRSRSLSEQGGKAPSAATPHPAPSFASPVSKPDAVGSMASRTRAADRYKSPVSPSTPPHADLPNVAPLIDTEFGGLLFLLNAFTALGLYGDFTRPADGLHGLSPFELIDLLGDRWFGATFRADPLNPLLRQLAGLAPHQRAGQDFEPPVWAVPDDWLAPWPPAKPLRRGNARWHPAGFAIADDTAAPLSVAWQRRRWVACLARYLEARLKRALDSDAAVEMACKRPAKIAHHDEHVEVHFGLEQHPIALRLAGLDRDPGWLPAAGRRVGFVFV